MNRVWWDLATDKTREAMLRTVNPYSPDVRYPAEGKAAPGLGRYDALVPPGTYTVTLAAAGQTMSQPIVVRRDPSSGAADAEIVAQSVMAGEIAADLNSTVDMVNALESVRAQLATVKATLGAEASVADLRAQTDSMSQHLQAVQEQLMQLRTTGRGQDLLRQPYRIGEQLVYLGQSIGSSDYGPTDAHRQVQVVLREALQKARVQFDAVMTAELSAYKQQLRSRNVQNAIVF